MKNILFVLTFLFPLAIGIYAGLGYADPYAPVYGTSVHTLYSPTPVGTVTPVQLVAATPSDCSDLDIFDSSGQTMELMSGPASSETRIRIIPPGGNGLVGQRIYAGTRLSVRSLSATANAGELDITCLQR